jgi:hypothetical protein
LSPSRREAALSSPTHCSSGPATPPCLAAKYAAFSPREVGPCWPTTGIPPPLEADFCGTFMDPLGRRSPTSRSSRFSSYCNTHRRHGNGPLGSVGSRHGCRPCTKKQQWKRLSPQKKKNDRQHLKPRSRRHLHSPGVPTESISPPSGSSRPLPALLCGRDHPGPRVLRGRGLFVLRRRGVALRLSALGETLGQQSKRPSVATWCTGLWTFCGRVSGFALPFCLPVLKGFGDQASTWSNIRLFVSLACPCPSFVLSQSRTPRSEVRSSGNSGCLIGVQYLLSSPVWKLF